MKLHASHCVFPTPDIQKTAEFYVEKLGFRRVDYLDAQEKHICLYRDGVEVILTLASSQRVFPNRELYGYGEDAYIIQIASKNCRMSLRKKGLRLFSDCTKRIITTWNFPLRISMEECSVLE